MPSTGQTHQESLSLAPEKQALLRQRLLGQRRTTGALEPPLFRRAGNHEAPLSSAQQRLWFLEQLEPGQALYHVPYALRLEGPLKLDLLQRSFNEVARRHEVLRTCFPAHLGAPMQMVQPLRPVPVTVVDLQALAGEAREAELKRRMRLEAERAFDLQRDLLLRVAVFQLESHLQVLLVTVHHIAWDAWSFGVLLRELAACYNAYARGESPGLPELPIQYADYAFWQQEYLAGERLERHLAYWKQQLANLPPLLELPADWPRPPFPASRGANRSLLLPHSLVSGLSELAREQQATLFMVLLAAFKVLLQRYSGREDLVVGTPVSRRVRKETEPLIGFFLNTLVLRTACSGRLTFLEFLQRVRETVLEGVAHQDLPFETLVAELHPARELSRAPLFQVMFTLQNALRSEAHFTDLRLDFLDFDLEAAPFDLTLYLEEQPQGLRTVFEYRTDLFAAETVDRMLGHYRVLLEAIRQDPRLPVSTLPVLTAPERHQLLDAFGRGDAVSKRAECLHTLFEAQAARTPEAVAVLAGAGRLTYRALNERANQLARQLQALGVGPEMLVGLFVERSLETVIGLLAILKAGGAYVPLDPEEPTERLAFKLRDSGARVLLTHRHLGERLPQPGASVAGYPASSPVEARASIQPYTTIYLDIPSTEIAGRSRENPDSGARPEHLAYLIYTSGSTGTPKGVMVEHQAVADHCASFARRFGLNPADRMLQFAPLGFDVSAEEIFPTLFTGGALVMLPAQPASMLQEFHDFLASQKLTVVNLPTSYWSQWLGEMEQRRLAPPASLRLVVAGSDSVAAGQLARWRKLAPLRARWCNAYGTTEATITSTLYEPAGEDLLSVVPIGRPLENTRAYILDEAGQLAPIGVPGELYLGGPIARGYWNQPELTAGKFVPDPFRPGAGARLVRTGDWSRWRPDGNLEFLGRKDDQVKIRGFRIELAEVEAALLQSPLVKAAAVTAREDSSGEKRLAAYLVPADPAAAGLAGKLRHFLQEKLPAYMIPAAFVPLPELPRLPGGKIDRHTLPAPCHERPDLEERFVPPGNSLERRLACLWRELLDLERVGVHDNFFDLGGHSLLAARLRARLETLTGYAPPLRMFFQFPTIRQLAREISRAKSGRPPASLGAVQSAGTRPPLFLVHGAGGGMLWGYGNLARHLGTDQPVYVFHSRGLEGFEEAPTIEAMAAAYVGELRAFQPAGPYRLGGYCFGGEVAFEMARQLQASGQEVELLALFNAVPPNSSYEQIRPTPCFVLRFLRNSWLWLVHFSRWTPAQRRTFIRRKLCLARKRLAGFRPRAPAPVREELDDDLDLSAYSDDERKLWRTHARASDHYHPGPYAGHIVLFRSNLSPFFGSLDPAFGWTDYARGGVTIKIVPGAHESILEEPHVAVLAAELKPCLPPAPPGRVAAS